MYFSLTCHLLRRIVVWATVLAGVHVVQVTADDSITAVRTAELLQEHCYACHSGPEPEGELQLDQLVMDAVHGDDDDHWSKILERLKFGDMPPDTEPPLKQTDRQLLMDWIAENLRRAELARPGVATFRRLTRREYEQTMQDLLGLSIEFGQRLPEDGKSPTGFRNDGDVLRMSPLQYETFLQIAEEALAEAIVVGAPPQVHRYRIDPINFQVEPLPQPDDRPGASFDYANHPFEITNGAAPSKNSSKDSQSTADRASNVLPPSAIVRFREAAVKPPQHCVAIRMHQAFRTGETIIKVHAARLKPEGSDDNSRAPILTLALGSTNFHGVELKTVGQPIVVDHCDARTYEFRVRMENVSVPNMGPLNHRNATILAMWNSALQIENDAQPPLLRVEWIEFENPVFETWPPPSHTAILFDDPSFDKEGFDEETYVRQVLERFATRAYREPLAAAELERLVEYWRLARKDTPSLEPSVQETLTVVLASPRFLGLPASRTGGEQQQLNDHELAARLSYFLWSTMPDAELRQLADQGRLHDPSDVSRQVRRMIQDPRSWAFVEQFAEQWLELDRLQRVVVHSESYPGFDDQLAAAMRLETIHFLDEVLRGDLSIFQFLESDFTCVNDVLAAHYGIAGVTQRAFRKVTLDGSLHRGGILTHAGILTGLSDGHDGHPIKRGVWLLKNLLDDPPPPPPPNVPELNREKPELAGLTITQALAVHRDSNSCLGCHRKIDPWGIAFEEYDAVGNWQRSGRGAELRAQRTQQPIDAETELPDGTRVNGLQELRQELMHAKGDDFRRTVVRKVMAYALGRALSPVDLEIADSLVPALRQRGDRLSALIELVVSSPPFLSK